MRVRVRKTLVFKNKNVSQMKAQIALLFRDHTHLLEEYWVFYEQLHSTMQQHVSEDEDDEEDEMETDGMPRAHLVHGVGESQHLEKAENQSLVQVMNVSDWLLFCFHMF